MVVVNNPYEIYYMCRQNIYVPHYALIRSAGYPPYIPSSYDFNTSENPEDKLAIILRSKQDTFLSIPALKALNIPFQTLNSRYGGPSVLAKYKALFYLPYQVSVMAMMENLRAGIIYLLPSPTMFLRLLENYSDYTFTESSIFIDQSDDNSNDNNDSGENEEYDKEGESDEKKNGEEDEDEEDYYEALENKDDGDIDEIHDQLNSFQQNYEKENKNSNSYGSINFKKTKKPTKSSSSSNMEYILTKWVEWYREEFRDVFIYYNGFEDLPLILNDLNNPKVIEKKKKEMKVWMEKMEESILSQWLLIISKPFNNPIFNVKHDFASEECKI